MSLYKAIPTPSWHEQCLVALKTMLAELSGWTILRTVNPARGLAEVATDAQMPEGATKLAVIGRGRRERDPSNTGSTQRLWTSIDVPILVAVKDDNEATRATTLDAAEVEVLNKIGLLSTQKSFGGARSTIQVISARPVDGAEDGDVDPYAATIITVQVLAWE